MGQNEGQNLELLNFYRKIRCMGAGFTFYESVYPGSIPGVASTLLLVFQQVSRLAVASFAPFAPSAGGRFWGQWAWHVLAPDYLREAAAAVEIGFRS